MPTGYTEAVRSGKITDFSEFALQCARAFGALNSMRDEPMDAPIPEEFRPADFYYENLEGAKTELARLKAMTIDEAAIEVSRQHFANIAEQRKWVTEREEQYARYKAMLEEVRAWTPPSPDHEPLKKFMIEQLEESIKLDCGVATYPPPAPLPSAATWLAKAIKDAENEVEWHQDKLNDEETRCRNRTAWLKALRESL